MVVSDTQFSCFLKCVSGSSTNSICIKNVDEAWQQSLMKIWRHLIFKDMKSSDKWLQTVRDRLRANVPVNPIRWWRFHTGWNGFISLPVSQWVHKRKLWWQQWASFHLTAERATYFSVPYSTHAKMKNTVHEGNERGSDVYLRVRN